MGPRTRRALHEALDLVLDAMAEDAREKAGEDPKKRRVRAPKERSLPAGVDDLTVRRALEAGRRAGCF